MLKVTTMGWIVRDFESKGTYGLGTIAVDTGFGDKKQTYFISILTPNTKILQYLTKGKPIMVIGDLTVKQYQKQDGTTGVGINVRADSITFLPSKKKEGEGNANVPTNKPQNKTVNDPQPAVGPDDIDEIPF